MSETKQRHLGGLNIAMALVDGASHEDMAASRDALERNGALVKIVSARKTPAAPGSPPADLSFEQARADDFDGVVIPGGTEARDLLQANEDAARLMRGMAKEGKPVGLIDGDIDATIQDFMKALAQRTKESVRGTADDLPGAAAMGG